jgi:hypothetical protein
MSAPVIPLSSLRQILAERYPQASRPAPRALATGLAAIDEAAGGLPCGALSEIVCAAPGCGGQLLLGELLRAVREASGRVALVDGHDSFDPQSWPEERLAHLVWARCADTVTALRAADIFARDANFALVVVDLARAPLAELRRTPAPFWYRLQRAAETADLALAVLTPRATVPSAKLRLQLERAHRLGAMEQARASLALELEPVVQRRRKREAIA